MVFLSTSHARNGSTPRRLSELLSNGGKSGSPIARIKDPCEAVLRSLITLKALTYAPTGGILAAATTLLPEKIGGVRNWDYRYCWVRDATFTLAVLMNGGYVKEAQAWRKWLLARSRARPLS